MEIRDSFRVPYFYLYILLKKKINQFKTEANVSKFLKQLHGQVLENMLEGEMDALLKYKKNFVTNNSDNSHNGNYPKKIQTEQRKYPYVILSWRNNRDNCFFHYARD